MSSALTGGGALPLLESGSGAVPLLEDLRKISRENEGNTERLTNVLKQMFAFDKSRFQRERDQQREADKERIQAIVMVQVAVVVLLKMKLQVVLVQKVWPLSLPFSLQKTWV